MIGSAAIIGAAERSLGEPMPYMHDLAAVSTKAFTGFARVSLLAGYRKHAPKQMLHLTRLGAILAEDCGPCARIVYKLAKRDKVSEAILRDGLNGGEALTGDDAAAYFFGRAISANDITASEELGAAIEASHGRNVRTELALAAALTRTFPALKRGLGYAKACSITGFDDL